MNTNRLYSWVRVSSLVCLLFAYPCSGGVNYEEAPISYSEQDAFNAVSKLQQRLDDGSLELVFDDEFGYLPALLDAFGLSKSSQVLTFAKTSKQKPRIAPHTPRAIYFNEDVYVGYVQDGLIEVAVTDAKLGMVFYTLEQIPDSRPQFRRDNSCLTCHGAAKTLNVPGLQVRSVVPDMKGEPVLAAGSSLSDHTSPFEKRWGGWYVTGTHQSSPHLGNFRLEDRKLYKQLNNDFGVNVKDLSSHFDTTKYLTPHSDLVALLVLEHQAKGINLITRLNFESQSALHLQRSDSRLELEGTHEPANVTEGMQRAAVELVRYILFVDEARLPGGIQGTSSFEEDFQAGRPTDAKGRSLYDLDLNTRLLVYPCSYLVYSDSFASLPSQARALVWELINDALRDRNRSGGDNEGVSPNLTKDQREASFEILRTTCPEFAKVSEGP